jgi:hypothetical protein
MMKKSLAVRIAVFFVVFSSLLVWVSIESAFAKSAKMEARHSTVMGRLVQVDSDYVVKSGKTSYMVTGQDFSNFVGKKVKVRGTVKRGEKGNVLEVTKIEEFKRKK